MTYENNTQFTLAMRRFNFTKRMFTEINDPVMPKCCSLVKADLR